MAPIPKADELSIGTGAGTTLQGYGTADPSSGDGSAEQGIPTLITWTHGGNHVSVDGSWDNWTTRYMFRKALIRKAL